MKDMQTKSKSEQSSPSIVNELNETIKDMQTQSKKTEEHHHQSSPKMKQSKTCKHNQATDNESSSPKTIKP